MGSHHSSVTSRDSSRGRSNTNSHLEKSVLGIARLETSNNSSEVSKLVHSTTGECTGRFVAPKNPDSSPGNDTLGSVSADDEMIPVESSKDSHPGKILRAKSALPPAKVAWSGVEILDRSKSMPTTLNRRADINLADETVAEVSRLQEARRASFIGEKNRRQKLSEAEILAFEKSCERFCYGPLNLTGVPGKERGMVGSLAEDVAVSCIKGVKGPVDTCPNQDNFSYYKSKGYEFYSVQDGHGPGGHHVSFRGVRTLALFVTRSKHFPSDMKAAIKEGYASCNQDIVLDAMIGGFDVQVSGCACTLLVRQGSRLWLSHAGDSRIVVGSLGSSSIVMETADHKPTDPAERTRLEACGSEVQTFSFDHNVKISRVFVKGTDYPGLCMSRSLGDQSVKNHGVTPHPEVLEFIGIPGKTFVLLASDGVWEFVPSALVCSSLSRKLEVEGKEKCVARIVTESRKRWRQNEGTYCDDITAFLILL